jgi:hypothetical protein
LVVVKRMHKGIFPLRKSVVIRYPLHWAPFYWVELLQPLERPVVECALLGRLSRGEVLQRVLVRLAGLSLPALLLVLWLASLQCCGRHVL